MVDKRNTPPSLPRRLLMAPKCLSLRHFRWLAAHLASGMVSYGPEAEELIRDLLRRCRVLRPTAMAEIYVGAMKVRDC